jgi:thiol-disulfide isomerase/thioredoxin
MALSKNAIRWPFLIGVFIIALTAINVQASHKTVELTLYNTSEKVTLSSLDNGKPTYVKLWASWCVPCMEQMPHFQEMYEQYGDSVNFIAVNININETTENIKQVIEKFELSMPVWLDTNGKMGVELDLAGTPYSVLLNKTLSPVYKSNNSDSLLQARMESLIEGRFESSEHLIVLNKNEKLAFLKPYKSGQHVLVFTATWCDWYLEQSRPEMAKTCVEVQTLLPKLISQTGHLPWGIVVNHLWTDSAATKEFAEKYKVDTTITIDKGGVLFEHFKVREIPAVLVVENGKVIERINHKNILINPSDMSTKLSSVF